MGFFNFNKNKVGTYKEIIAVPTEPRFRLEEWAFLDYDTGRECWGIKYYKVARGCYVDTKYFDKEEDAIRYLQLLGFSMTGKTVFKREVHVEYKHIKDKAELLGLGDLYEYKIERYKHR